MAGRCGRHCLAGRGGCPAAAQDYPTRPITVIVPFAAGGPTDVIARIVGEHMSRRSARARDRERRRAPAAPPASTRAKRAKPDGYTIVTGHMGTQAAAVGALSEPAI